MIEILYAGTNKPPTGMEKHTRQYLCCGRENKTLYHLSLKICTMLANCIIRSSN